MASTMITSGSRSSAARNKTRKKMNPTNQISTEQNGGVSWKSEVQQHVYSSKLLQALRQLRINSAPKRRAAVREAADKVLAVAAKGRSRWSRALLTNRLKLKFLKKITNKRVHSRRGSSIATGNSRSSQKKGRVGILRLKARNLPAVQRRVKVLSRLVPGCREQPMPVVLEEAGDYIAALEMQVRAMSALANLLAGSASSSQLGSSHPPL